MTEPSLFRPMKTCCVCDWQTAAWQKRRKAGEPDVIAVSTAITRRGNGKSQLKAAGSVQICETCFVKALAGFPAIVRMVQGKDLKFWSALAGALSNRYSAMVKEDAA